MSTQLLETYRGFK